MKVNLYGTFHFCRLVAARMVEARGKNANGVLVNVASVAATDGQKGQVAYAASKGAVESMTRALANELARKKIRVNAVAPGVIVTDMSARVREAAGDQILGEILLRRFGDPQEVASVIAFLASDDADYMTGQVLSVDGGFKM